MNNKDDYLAEVRLLDEKRRVKESKAFADIVQVKTILDPEGLANECRKGFIKMKVINSNEFMIYENPNHKGNPLCSIGLNKVNAEYSNSENARFTARNRLINIIKANPDFTYFFTGTFNPKKWDRKNLTKLHSSLTRWCRRRGIKYILVPELHKDGSIHFHGFFNSTIEPFLDEFDLTKKLPTRITDGLKEGRKIFNCPDYAKMFGWVSIEKVRSLEACAVYCSKYVCKTFEDEKNRLSYHRYFCSTGLKRPFSDLPTAEKLEGFTPVRFSKKIVKVTYKRLNSPKTLGGPFEPVGVRTGASVPKIISDKGGRQSRQSKGRWDGRAEGSEGSRRAKLLA